MNLFIKIFFVYYRIRFPIIKQNDQTDCGPATLLSILRFYGGNSNLEHIREICRTTIYGSTMLDLVFAAEKLGFKAKGVEGSYQALTQCKLPCIVHTILENRRQHFMVL